MANKGGITRGEWKSHKGWVTWDRGDIQVIKDQPGIHNIAYIPSGEKCETNAEFICLCANQCQAINPTHPEYVAEKIGEILDGFKHSLARWEEWVESELAGTSMYKGAIAKIKPYKQLLADIERRE